MAPERVAAALGGYLCCEVGEHVAAIPSARVMEVLTGGEAPGSVAIDLAALFGVAGATGGADARAVAVAAAPRPLALAAVGSLRFVAAAELRVQPVPLLLAEVARAVGAAALTRLGDRWAWLLDVDALSARHVQATATSASNANSVSEVMP